MQDNTKNHQQLSNKGWQKMSALLDQEMPQTARRNRRLVWWFFAAGALLILSAVGYHFLTSGSDMHAPIPPQSNERIAVASETPIAASSVSSNSKGLDEISQIQSDDSATLEQAQPSDKDVPGISVEPEQSVSSEKINSGDIRQNSVAELKQVMPEQVQTALNDARNVNSADQTNESADAIQDFVKAIPEVNTSDVIQEDVSEDAEEQVRPVIPSQGLPVHQSRLASSSVSFIIPASKQPVIRHPVGMEAIVAVHANSDGNPFYGVESGLSAFIPIGRRSRIHGGITYGYYNVDGLNVFGLLKQSSDAEALGQPGTDPFTGLGVDVQDVYDGNLAYSDANRLAEKFHYLHFPFTVDYRVSKRFSAVAGVKLSALLSAPARYRLNDARLSNQYLSLPSSNSFLYDYHILNKFDVAPVVGIEFRFAPRWSVDARYSHGMIHYINADASNSNSFSDQPARNDFHRSFSIGMRYRIL